MPTHGHRCKCDEGPGVGEYLLSLGLQSADPKQLAAGEGLYRICRGAAEAEEAEKAHAEKAQEEQARWERVQRGITEEVARQMTAASTQFQAEAQRVADQAETLKKEAAEVMARQAAAQESSGDAAARVAGELRALQALQKQSEESAAERVREWSVKVEVLQAEREGCQTELRRAEGRADAAAAEARREGERRQAAEKEVELLRQLVEREGRQREEAHAAAGKDRERAAAAAGEAQHTIAALHARAAEMAEAAAAAKVEHERKCMECDAKAEEVEATHRELNNLLSSKLEDVEALKKSFEGQAAECRAKRIRAEEAVDAATARNETLTRELAETKAALAVAERDRAAVAQRAGEADAALKLSQTEHAHAGEKLRAAEAAAEDERRRAAMKVEEANKTAHAALDKHKALQDELAAAAATIAAHKATHATLHDDLTRTNETLTGMQAEIDEMDAALADKAAALAGEVAARAAAEAQGAAAAAGLEAELAAAAAALSEAAEEAAMWKGEATELKAAVEELRLAGDPELRAQIDRSTSAAAELEVTLKSYESVQESLSARNDDLADAVKDLRMELAAVTEERDALKESVAMGRYDAMDHMLQTTAPKLTSAEARKLQQDSEDYRRIKAMMERLVDYLHTSSLQMQDVLGDLLTCLPAVPPMQDVDVKELEATHAHLSSLLRDVARTHIDAAKREEEQQNKLAVAEVRERLVNATTVVQADKPSHEEKLMSMLSKSSTVPAPSRTTTRRSAPSAAAAATAERTAPVAAVAPALPIDGTTLSLSASPIQPSSLQQSVLQNVTADAVAAAAAVASLSAAAEAPPPPPPTHVAHVVDRSVDIAASIAASSAHGYKAVPRQVSPTRGGSGAVVTESRARSPVRQRGHAATYTRTAASKNTMRFGGVYSVPVARGR